MDDVTIGVIGTLLGTILGFALSETSAWIKANKTEKRQNHTIRTALSIEVQTNLEMLNILISNFERAPDDQVRAEMLESYKLTFPPWKKVIWQSQLPHVASVLTPQELATVSQIYQRLEYVKDVTMRTTGQRAAKFIWDRARQIQAVGNPLQKWVPVDRISEIEEVALLRPSDLK